MELSNRKQKLLELLGMVAISYIVSARSVRHGLTPPMTTNLTELFPRFGFEDKFLDFYGGKNVQKVNNGSAVNLVLDKSSGSGFSSKDTFYHGFFSAAIKLPSGFSAGVVVAFYMSNNQVFTKNHDEIDFELLGHEKQKEWVLQTNIYANGSVSTGREEKFYLWFDPTEEFHQYSILWNDHHIVFLVDNIPVREVIHSEAMTAYPSKPMSLYSTIWDGSDWATHGGNKPINYNYAPFVASFEGFELQSSVSNQTRPSSRVDPVDGQQFAKLTQDQQSGMGWVRNKFMFYSYCNDTKRFNMMPPECDERS
ncbi:hypothetical protein KFK09_017092 [Dendrobium nobile]|uniref:Xyloglucan endotransglucosylase/hydrolase n=1 Tax=Dendrobium nobile TaxID=94219 RepID=A0A8T3B6H6_DENNO|nr:hypothetical protein KFK09_017092 [Dendrobium nobile]